MSTPSAAMAATGTLGRQMIPSIISDGPPPTPTTPTMKINNCAFFGGLTSGGNTVSEKSGSNKQRMALPDFIMVYLHPDNGVNPEQQPHLVSIGSRGEMSRNGAQLSFRDFLYSRC